MLIVLLAITVAFIIAYSVLKINSQRLKMIFFVIAALFLTACGKDGLKKLEYNIGGEWLHCSQVADAPCGLTLRCNDEIYQCVNDVQIRAR